jgi:H+-translocating NAD(P) transhydrogenase subunit alpha
LIVAVLRETRDHELRVAQVPDTIVKLIKSGVTVTVETGAGAAAGFPDAAYEKVGATIASTPQAALQGADLVLKVQAPTEAELELLRPGTTLVSFLPQAASKQALADRKVNALQMERVPRTTRGQAVDALSSQATVAGYKAVLLGAGRLNRLLPMMTTAAGTLTPGKVLVLGAGVAGLQAIATAHRLGAQVFAFDVRAAVKEQINSLGAKFIEIEGVANAEGSGGYAKEVGQDEQARILSTLGKQVPAMDLVITTAQIPNRPAPRLVTAAMVAAMRPGSVIVDLAAETGGNVEGTRVGEEVITPQGVVLVGARNLAATMPLHASMMYARNVLTLVQLCIKDGALHLNLQDDLVAAMLVTLDGVVRHP